MAEFMNTVDIVGDEALASSIIDKSISEIADSVTKKIGVNIFYGCKVLSVASFLSATEIAQRAFYECSNLTEVSFPIVTSIGNEAFRDCKKLTAVTLPATTTFNGYAFCNCASLIMADLPIIKSIGTYELFGCSALTAVILRSGTMCTLTNSNAFLSTPIASGTGYIYVPRALVDTYKAATNWSTYAAQFRALEDYTVDGTTTGELDSTKI